MNQIQIKMSMLNSGVCMMIVHCMTVYMNITQRKLVEVNILAVHADGTSLEDGDDALDSEGSSFNDYA